MKRFFFLFLLIAASVAVKAQTATEAPKATPEERAHTQTLRLQKLLTLTPEQFTQVEQIMLTRVKKVDAIKADQTKSKEEKKAAADVATAEQDKELEKVLTKEQYAKYIEQKQLKQQRRQQAEGASGQ